MLPTKVARCRLLSWRHSPCSLTGPRHVSQSKAQDHVRSEFIDPDMWLVGTNHDPFLEYRESRGFRCSLFRSGLLPKLLLSIHEVSSSLVYLEFLSGCVFVSMRPLFCISLTYSFDGPLLTCCSSPSSPKTSRKQVSWLKSHTQGM